MIFDLALSRSLSYHDNLLNKMEADAVKIGYLSGPHMLLLVFTLGLLVFFRIKTENSVNTLLNVITASRDSSAFSETYFNFD